MALSANTLPHPCPEISGYTRTEQLYLGSRTAVYRAVQTATQRPVVIKVLRRDYPSFGELVQFRNQYTIAKNLPIPHCPALELGATGQRLCLGDGR
jgi:serine/threonine protein kinase